MSRQKKTFIFIMIGLLVFGVVSFISSDILKAADPQGVTVTLLKTQIMTSATGTAVTIVDRTADGRRTH